MGLIQSNEDLKIKDLRFPEEGILPQNCKIEILPKFSACWPAQFCQPLSQHEPIY